MFQDIQQEIDVGVRGLKFKPKQVLPALFVGQQTAPARIASSYVRKNPFVNRAFALVEVSPTEAPIMQIIGAHKEQIGDRLGYVPFFYVQALHLVLAGPGIAPPAYASLDSLVDKVNTVKVNLLTIHAIDTEARSVAKARSWNAFFSGKIESVVDAAIERALAKNPVV